MPVSVDTLPALDERGSVRVVVEASAGTRSKLKYEPALQAFALHRVLAAGLAFPLDFGFVPGTKGEDGDPLDALLFADEPLPVGAVVPSRVVGVLPVTQSREGGGRQRNDRFLAVALASERHGTWHTLGDIPPAVLDGITRFLQADAAHRGIRVEVAPPQGSAEAMRLLLAGVQ